MSKKQRVPGEDLLFSQSELAELDAELAPQTDDAALGSARTPPQSTPPSLDDLVDTAFNDEETAEKQMMLSDDADLGAGFSGFVEAEPASTGEILAAMEGQDLVSSAPVFQPRESARHGTPTKSSAGEITSSRSSPAPVAEDLPSVMFDDSPFAEGAASASDDAREIAPQLAALAASIDHQAAGGPLADTVLSSSPPPNADSPSVEVVSEGGGSLPNLRGPALVALNHAIADAGDEQRPPASPDSDADEPATAPPSASGNTPIMALDEEEFHLVEDSEERATEYAADSAPSDAGADPDAAATMSDDNTSGPVSLDDGSPLPAPTAGPHDASIDAAWSTAGDSEAAPSDEPSDGPASRSLDDDGESFASRATPVSEPASEAAAPVTAELSVSSDGIPSDLVEAEPSLPTAVANSQSESSRVSPARELAPLPPIPRDALRKTSPGIAPPPPPPAAKAPPPPPKVAASPNTPPPPPPAAARSSAPPPSSTSPSASQSGGLSFGEETKLRKKRRAKQWFEEIFDEDYLHTLPFMTPHQTEREVAFLLETLELPAGGRVLDLGCGYGRHAMEMAARGYRTVGLDLSLPLLIRATDAARRVGVNVDFVHGDMREMTFESEFDGAYCFFTTFGFFDDDTNRRVASGICRALKPGGRLVLEMINRDYLIGDLPTRVWWQGDGCVVLEEVDFNYFTSRLQVQRQIILENGRQLEQEISIRAYSLHEIGKVLHHAGFRVLEVSGNLDLRGRFFGNESRQLVVVAERRADG